MLRFKNCDITVSPLEIGDILDKRYFKRLNQICTLNLFIYSYGLLLLLLLLIFEMSVLVFLLTIVPSRGFFEAFQSPY